MTALQRASAGVLAALLLASSQLVVAQQPASVPSPGEPTTAFVNVQVITMTNGPMFAGQTVLVRGDRIVAVGGPAAVPVPEHATVIDGQGRYLLPGLTDSHVHLTTDMPWAPARPDFGDAPIYLAHGVTSVINLRGSDVQLDWRRRVDSGELVGPTIYTSGEFVNEPRVDSPEQVAQEIARQGAAGYDLIKFHEIWTPEAGFITTAGLSGASYLAMNEAVARAGLPLVGHAPVNLGLDALIKARQPLAHLGGLSNLYFLPLASNSSWLVTTFSAIVALVVIAVVSGVVGAVGAWQRATSKPPPVPSSVGAWGWVQAILGVAAVICGASFLPGGPLYDSMALRLVFTLLVAISIAVTVAIVVRTLRALREPSTSTWRLLHCVMATAASSALAFTAVGFWLPIAWRSSDPGIERLAVRLAAAGTPIQTTLVAYDAIGGPGRSLLAADPTFAYLSPATRTRWRRIAEAPGPFGYRYTEFMAKVAGRLHRSGVPLMVGTDAMGLALVAPGSSLHRELELLVQGGLTPYDAIRAATAVPAAWLGRHRDFGTVATGQRADVVLVDGNPLDDITRLRRPDGVMVRGRWFSRDDLDAMLLELARDQ